MCSSAANEGRGGSPRGRADFVWRMRRQSDRSSGPEFILLELELVFETKLTESRFNSETTSSRKINVSSRRVMSFVFLFFFLKSLLWTEIIWRENKCVLCINVIPMN